MENEEKKTEINIDEAEEIKNLGRISCEHEPCPYNVIWKESEHRCRLDYISRNRYCPFRKKEDG